MQEGRIRVYVYEESGRRYYRMKYQDPVSGEWSRRSTEVPVNEGRRKDADRAGAVWEAELNAGLYTPPSQVSWEEFRDRYEAEVLPGVEPKTRTCYRTALNAFERVIGKPPRLAVVNGSVMSRFCSELRKPRPAKPPEEKQKGRGRRPKEQVTEATIASYLRGLRAAFRWASDTGLMPKMPKFPRLRASRSGAARMKGRPLTREEFERMLKVVSKVVGKEAAPLWRTFLRGLWWSGLRLDEALHLYWAPTPSDEKAIAICSDGAYPMLWIPPKGQKNRQEQLLPVAPEFWRFLEKRWPEDQREGRVFRLTSKMGNSVRDLRVVSKTISQIGERASVVVDAHKGKFASAHDLRRSFGLRWATRVLPQVLQGMMRHKDIATTMTYYVGSLAETTAAGIWSAWKRERRKSSGTRSGTKAGSETEKHE
jgi:integrase